MATPTISTANLTRINNCDSATGWASVTGGGAGPGATDDVVRQGTAAISRKIDNTSAGFGLDLGASTLDFTAGGSEEGEHIFFWVNILQPGLINSMSLRLSSSSNSLTDYNEYQIFPANLYSGGWYRAVINPLIDPTSTNGTFDLSAVRWISFIFDMGDISGNANNCIIDAIDRGRGLIITGGTTSDKITWSDIATLANNNTNAYGIIEEQSGVFFLNGEIQLGDGTNNCYFEDTDKLLVWEPNLSNDGTNIINGVTDDLNRLIVVEGTGTTDVICGVKSGTGDNATGTNGCTFQAAPVTDGIRTHLTIDFSDADITNIEMYGCTFRRCVGDPFRPASIIFCSDATNGPNHEVSGCLFESCGIVDPGRVSMQNNVFAANEQIEVGIAFTEVKAFRATDTPTWLDGTSNMDDRGLDDWTPFVTSGSNGNGDIAYFGYHDEFVGMYFQGQSAPNGTNYVWEYWNGSTWSSLSSVTGVADLTSDIGGDILTWTLPGDWARTTVNAGTSLYFVRWRSTSNWSATASDLNWSWAYAIPVNSAAMLWNSNIDVVNSLFAGNADADTNEKSHGIEHRASGTFSYTGLTFASNDADILFTAASGDLTINASAGANPSTSTVTGSGSVTINNNINVTLTGLIASPATEVRVYEAGTTTEIDGAENVVTGTFTFQAQASDAVDIVIHNVEYEYLKIENFTIPTSDVSIPITQFFDRVYKNP